MHVHNIISVAAADAVADDDDAADDVSRGTG